MSIPTIPPVAGPVPGLGGVGGLGGLGDSSSQSASSSASMGGVTTGGLTIGNGNGGGAMNTLMFVALAGVAAFAYIKGKK